MCGIFGFSSNKTSCDIGSNIINNMAKVLGHRGPDDTGFTCANDFWLGNVLLSVVDIGRGHQPFKLTHQGRTYYCVFNGEVYNYIYLQTELKARGFHFKTMCDTEVVLAAFSCWGLEAFSKFVGQWAVAIWDETTKTLHLSRDPFGIKPLYFWHENDFLAFASEPKALFVHPKVSKSPEHKAIIEYFVHGFAFAAGYATGSRSFYRNVKTLPAGHYLKWQKGANPVIRQYFQLPIGQEFSADERNEIVKYVRESVEESIISCLMGDAPIGVALSGGLDSSIITSVTSRFFKKQGKAPLLAACIEYETQSVNEDMDAALILARYLASKAPLNLVTTTMKSEDYLDDLDRMLFHFDEPQWEVKQLAMFKNYETLKRHGAKVVLTGEGADELFFGYYHKFPGFLNPVINSSDELFDLWKRRLPIVKRLIAKDYHESLEPLMRESIFNYCKKYEGLKLEPARKMQCWYIHTFLPWLLLDNDRCSMAHSLEGRFPYLNRQVFEIALKIPVFLQIVDQHGLEKLILRDAFKDVLPPEIWRYRKKSPLPSPVSPVYYKILAKALKQAISDAPHEVWNILDKNGVKNFSEQYSQAVEQVLKEVGFSGLDDTLVAYLRFQDDWSIRMPQAFGLLCLLRWWALNF